MKLRSIEHELAKSSPLSLSISCCIVLYRSHHIKNTPWWLISDIIFALPQNHSLPLSFICSCFYRCCWRFELLMSYIMIETFPQKSDWIVPPISPLVLSWMALACAFCLTMKIIQFYNHSFPPKKRFIVVAFCFLFFLICLFS